jgi:hypothetical protein
VTRAVLPAGALLLWTIALLSAASLETAGTTAYAIPLGGFVISLALVMLAAVNRANKVVRPLAVVLLLAAVLSRFMYLGGGM